MSVTSWQHELLKDIDALPKEGVPGRIAVFGQHAEPILTGSEEEDVLVAAAELGHGRIVCIAHNGYSKNFSDNVGLQDNSAAMYRFHNNVKKWLTKGSFQDNASIVNIQNEANPEKLKSAKILMWHGGQGKMPAANVEEFVRRGGGLFYSITPWGWLQGNKNKTLSDVPYATLIMEAGICYTSEYINAIDNKFSVKDNKAKDAHLLRVLQEVEKNPNKAEHHFNMLKRLKYLPDNALHPLRPMVETLWKKCNEDVQAGKIPSSKHPITNKKDQTLLELWLLFVGVLDVRNIKAPGVDIFPGDFDSEPPMKCLEFEFSSDRQDYYPTSCYLPAGKTMKLEIISGNKDKDWQVLIGCHTDHLTKDNIRRWPKVSRRVKLTSNGYELSSAFGGLIYFISPDRANTTIKVKLDHVVDSPQFNLKNGEKEKEKWKSSRNAPGLWADIIGDLITITLPASSVRHLDFDQLTSATRLWDSIILLYHDLRGTDVSKFRRQWIVADEQPSVGYMHAGYPIVTGLDVIDPKGNKFLLDSEQILIEGRWGVFHEIGHNMQRREWTFEGTGEVTCNIFTLCAMDFICNLKPWIHSWLRDQMRDTEKYLKDGAEFKTWKSKAGVGLFIYAQLIHEFGWNSYKKVFRKYEAMSENEKPKEDHKKIDTWFFIFSEAVNYNLSPLAKFWGIGLSVEMTKRLEATLPIAFLPDDEITKMAPARVAAILKQFPNIARIGCR